MNDQTPIKKQRSLLERATELYGFDAPLREGAGARGAAYDAPDFAPHYAAEPKRDRPVHAIDRDLLRANNFIVPEDPVSALAEEFRIVKRQLLLAARGGKGYQRLPQGERILICSADQAEGKTFCAINLALSIASEKDNRVLLIDADFAKGDIAKKLQLPEGPGFLDALSDPSSEIEDMILDTDVDGLSVLRAGSATRNDTELLASSRTERLLERLTRVDPQRIVIFDSPPALAASPASVLALNVGQAVMVVRADHTSETMLRDAVRLLSGCENIQLLLNAARFSPTGQRFGSYYGQGANP